MGEMRVLSKEQKIKCGWCNTVKTAKEWNDNTYAECKTRDMRRSYTPIYKESTFLVGADTFYKCPSCSLWLRGCQLAIVGTTNKRLLRLGRKPVIKEVIDNDYNSIEDD